MFIWVDVDRGAAHTEALGRSFTRGYGITGAVMASAEIGTALAMELAMMTCSDILVGSAAVNAVACDGEVKVAITCNAVLPLYGSDSAADALGTGEAFHDTVPGGNPHVTADVVVSGAEHDWV